MRNYKESLNVGINGLIKYHIMVSFLKITLVMSYNENSPNRKFFLLENAQKIDDIRQLIERYYQKKKITKSEYFY